MPKNSVHKEVYGSKHIIEKYFGQYIYGGKLLGLGRPGLTDCNKVVATLDGVTYDTCYTWFNKTFDEAIKSGDYYFGRGNNKKIVKPSDLAKETVRNNIPSFVPTSSTLGAGDASVGIEFINEAIASGGWANFSFHCIDTGWHTVTTEEITKLFDYAEGLGNDLWIATFTEGAMYYSEWSTAQLSTSYNAVMDEITVTLTDGENDTLCVMPLTVKVYVPGNWDSVTMNGEVLTVQYDENGNAFVYADIVPDSGVKTIKAN